MQDLNEKLNKEIIKIKEETIEILFEKESMILNLKDNFKKSENLYLCQIEKLNFENKELREKCLIYESDDYFNYLEAEILKNYSEDKFELENEIIDLRKRLNENNIKEK